MNNLLFSAMVIALIYYCFFYLPSQKSNANQPQQQNQAVQTDELELKNKQVQTEPIKDEQITNLKKTNQKLLESVNLDEKVFLQLKQEMQELTEQLN